MRTSTLPYVGNPQSAAEPVDRESAAKPIPELPPALTDIWPVVAVGSGLWFVAFIVMLVRYFVSSAGADIWLWTTLAGVVISLIGVGILLWQRAAAKRGSRSAQRVG